MMAWLQMWTIAITALSVSIAVSDSHFPLVEAEQRGEVEIVKKETHHVLFRQKRDWIWNSLYVEEEKPAPIPYKIGKLKSSKRVDVKSFKIEGEGANTIFHVDMKGDLFVSRSLDREEKNAYNLTATMFDGNNQLIEDSGEFVVQVTDINDNTPVFPKTYNGSIMERSTIGTKVIEVRATDADDPTTANGELKYSLIQDRAISPFEIHSTTGVISCKTNTLDRETQSRFVVVVKAQDMRGMASGSTSTTSVTISITDANDNYASFTRRIYELQVPEDHKLNEKIGTLELEDRDEIQNKEPTFTILNENSKMFNFELSPNKDGNLMLKQALDYETKSIYTFTVQVRENPAFPRRQRTVPSPQLRYSILDKDCPIGIHPFTGQLSTQRTLDRELEATHMFQVKAQEEPSDSTADIMVKQGPFNLDDPKDYSLDVRISDGGSPLQASITKLAIKSCRCDARRIPTQCKASARSMGVSVHALIAILLCILTILVIVILFVMRKRYQKDSLVSMKNSGEIHEQLVTYDEEGGGEMDTNG
ncbi:hypothetical protein KUCAC02_031521, partial [Chaenocephalus aceratus]